MRDHVLLYVNGRRLEVRGPGAFAPLSTFLRQHLELTGTKVVCAEGDCGACAVLVGRPSDSAGGADRLDYRPLTSCIAMTAQFDRAHVLTVEGLARDHELHPVQQAMVTHHASQCGYCTPGFVMTLCAHAEHGASSDAADLRTALTGNLCRCTGYESILDAGAHVDRARLRPLNDLYPPAPLLDDFSRAGAEGLRHQSAGQSFFQPTTLPEALAYKAAHPDCTILAGGTDLGVQQNKGVRALGALLSLTAIPGLASIGVTPDALTVGANATLADFERAARRHYPELYPMLTRHGSPLIRNAGTLTGNIVNGSPIADALPALYVVNAEVELVSYSPSPGPQACDELSRVGDGRGEGLPSSLEISTRRVNLNEFFTGYKRTVMRPDELIAAVHIPRLKPDEILRLYKVSKRRDLDISTFTAAIHLKLSGDTIRGARLAYGGVGPNILRLPETESLLAGQPVSEDLFRRAGRLARTEISPISDVRGHADYRLQLAENILLRFYHEIVQPDSATERNGYAPDATPHRSPLVPPPSSLE